MKNKPIGTTGNVWVMTKKGKIYIDPEEIYSEPKKSIWKGILLIIGFIAFAYAFCYLTVGI